MNLSATNNSEQFESLISHIEQTRSIINSSAAAVIIIKDDQIVTEWYSGYHHDKPGAKPVTADSQFNVYSIRKTHIGLALALAVIEADLALDTPVHPFIEDISKDELKTVTIGNVLTKTNPKFFGPNKIEGEGLAARIVKKVTGKTIAQLIREKILEPLQLKNTEWISIPKDNIVCDFTAGDGYASIRLESDEGDGRNLYMTAKDLAYWGYLYLNNGVINGAQIIPKSVIDLSEKLKSTPEYANKRIMGWYFGDDMMFEAEGATGCHVVIIPKYKTVAVRMYNRYATTHIETLLKCLKHDVSTQTAL
ncbi:serine hydrolase domain-containing protein [Paenibacillus alkalitolerans]|uniref:serine hydrolase domain-containing protein n=1 Tax=Paenibacillus alkalitolerans TaxID=2799335 RepID=UPI0018F5CE0E|nr:serine hydrolase domain-containing protein [Paenibacillus alkalitolerans]